MQQMADTKFILLELLLLCASPDQMQFTTNLSKQVIHEEIIQINVVQVIIAVLGRGEACVGGVDLLEFLIALVAVGIFVGMPARQAVITGNPICTTGRPRPNIG